MFNCQRRYTIGVGCAGRGIYFTKLKRRGLSLNRQTAFLGRSAHQ